MEAWTGLLLAGLVLGTVALLFARDVAAALFRGTRGHPNAVRVLGLIVAGGCSTVLTLHLVFGCTSAVFSEVPQPAGSLRAVLHRLNCGGATVGYDDVHLSLLEPGEAAPREGNAFRGLRRSGASWGVLEAEVRWTSPTAVTLEHHADLQVVLAEPHVRGVEVTCDAR